MSTEAQIYLQQVYCCYYFLVRQADKLWASSPNSWARININTGERHQDLRALLVDYKIAKRAVFLEDEKEEARRRIGELTDASIAKLATQSPWLMEFGPVGPVELSLRGPVDVLGRAAFNDQNVYVTTNNGRKRRLPAVAR